MQPMNTGFMCVSPGELALITCFSDRINVLRCTVTETVGIGVGKHYKGGGAEVTILKSGHGVIGSGPPWLLRLWLGMSRSKCDAGHG